METIVAAAFETRVPVPWAKPSGPYSKSKLVAAEQAKGHVKSADVVVVAAVTTLNSPGEGQVGAAAIVIK